MQPPLRDSARWLRRLAAILGALGTILAIAVPFLPVTHDMVTLHWPTAQGTAPVSAPLVSYQPLQLTATVPCPAVRNLAARDGYLLDTTPPSAEIGRSTGMSLQVRGGQLLVTTGGQQLAKAMLPPTGDCDVTLHSDSTRTTVQLGGQPLVDQHNDIRPQVSGIYSDLDSHKDNVAGAAVDIRVDNRFATTATVIKYVAIVSSAILFLACLLLLNKLDAKSGRRAPRLAPKGWWKPTWRDIVVFGVLAVWSVIGAITSDDGYILSMARARGDSGYIGNYFRWFNAPEAPFGWFYELYSGWVQISTATPWVRLPALLMGICSWLLISREVLPRLGQQVRRSGAAGWAAAAVFLSFWLPYNNGLRPEPVVTICSLLAMCAVERAVATRRLLPAALGLVSAAFALAATPTGLMALLPFVAASRPLVRLTRERVRDFGLLPVLAPLAAAGTVVLSVIFEDQTWRSVLEAKALETAIGPANDWYQELIRYESLFSPTPDGSLARRFPVLLVVFCLVICLVVLLRRGNIRGAALGPSRRLLGVTMMSFVVLALTPTKWTHHFGAFAALGGSLAALGALATSTTVLRSRRNRAFFVAGLLVIAALASTGPNSWWYVSTWGVPWFDKLPSIHGHTMSTALLIPAAIALVYAAIEHLRIDESGIPRPISSATSQAGSKRRGRLSRLEGPGRGLLLGSAPLAIVCAVMVLLDIASMGKALQKESNTYSLGKNSIEQLAGVNTCGLSDYIDVEPHPLQDILPQAKQPTAPDEQPIVKGFHRNGVPGSNPAVSSANWTPPYGLGGDKAPVYGTFDQSGISVGELRTGWYTLNDDARSGRSPLVVPIAGQESDGNSLVAEFGKQTATGYQVVATQPLDVKGAPQWREVRTTLSGAAAKADTVRLVAKANVIGVDGWMAVGTPRVPKLERLTQFIGNSPVLMEWPAALVYPCLRQPSLHNGIAEMPKYRIAAGMGLRDVGVDWSAPASGGPFGWLNVSGTARELPTFLRGSVDEDWGTLYAVDPYVQGQQPPQAAEQVRQEVHWGTFSPGPSPIPLQIPENQPETTLPPGKDSP